MRLCVTLLKVFPTENFRKSLRKPATGEEITGKLGM